VTHSPSDSTASAANQTSGEPGCEKVLTVSPSNKGGTSRRWQQYPTEIARELPGQPDQLRFHKGRHTRPRHADPAGLGGAAGHADLRHAALAMGKSADDSPEDAKTELNPSLLGVLA